MRPIDADELKKKAKLRGHCISLLVTAFNMCVDVHDIDNAPTINPEDLRPKGKWIPSEFGFPDRSKKCSRCGEYEEPRTEKKKPFPDYCPNCGAKMEG